MLLKFPPEDRAHRLAGCSMIARRGVILSVWTVREPHRCGRRRFEPAALEASSKTPERGCLLPRQAVNLGHQNNGSPRMEAPIIDDELWILIEPLLPPAKLRAKSDPGRPRVSDRVALNGILFVFKTGIRWNHLPTRLGFGSGATCWRRLSDWQKAGVWDQLHELLLDKLRAAGQIDLSYAAVDSSSVRAVGAGEKLARTPPIARDPVPSTTSS